MLIVAARMLKYKTNYFVSYYILISFKFCV